MEEMKLYFEEIDPKGCPDASPIEKQTALNNGENGCRLSFKLSKKNVINPPKARGGCTLTRTSAGSIFLIGGASHDATHYGDVHVLSKNAMSWEKVVTKGSLPPRSGHTACLISNSIICVFGGMNLTEQIIYNDLYLFDTENLTWSKVSLTGQAPSPRNAHTSLIAGSLSGGGNLRMVVFGGSSPLEGPMNDLHVLHINANFSSFRWEKISQSQSVEEIPLPRELHSAFTLGSFSHQNHSDSLDQRALSRDIYFFGGRLYDGTVSSELFKLDLDTYKWTKMVPATGYERCSHIMTVVRTSSELRDNNEEAREQLVIFGGYNTVEGILSDCIVFDISSNSWKRFETQKDSTCDQVARFASGACSTEHGDGFVIFGGMALQGGLQDTCCLKVSQI